MLSYINATLKANDQALIDAKRSFHKKTKPKKIMAKKCKKHASVTHLLYRILYSAINIIHHSFIVIVCFWEGILNDVKIYSRTNYKAITLSNLQFKIIIRCNELEIYINYAKWFLRILIKDIMGLQSGSTDNISTLYN